MSRLDLQGGAQLPQADEAVAIERRDRRPPVGLEPHQPVARERP